VHATGSAGRVPSSRQFARRAWALCVVWSTLCLFAVSPPANAQSFGPPDEAQSFAAPGSKPAEPTLTFGPLGLTPKLALRHVGIDSNVFNDPHNPSRDVVAIVVPGADASMRVGPARLASRTLAEWNHFHKLTEQRSVNLTQHGRVDLDLARFVPYVEAGYLRSRHRPNLEIDARVLQKSRTLAAGVLITLGPRTSLDVGMRRAHVDFGDPSHGSLFLATRLNRDTSQVAIETRVALSALTTLIFTGQHRRDRFEFDTVRDSDNLVIAGGIEMKTSALLSGTASVGIRRLDARSAITPDHADVVAAMRVRYVLREQTRFNLRLDRDVDYSFDAEWPYFVATSALLEVKQAVGFVWDVVVRGGRSELAYRRFLAGGIEAPTDAGDRRDHFVTVGLGAGRHLGDDVRVGVDVNRDRRQSPVLGRSYSGYRVGGSVTYGY
jgi:hypothetical protein